MFCTCWDFIRRKFQSGTIILRLSKRLQILGWSQYDNIVNICQILENRVLIIVKAYKLIMTLGWGQYDHIVNMY